MISEIAVDIATWLVFGILYSFYGSVRFLYEFLTMDYNQHIDAMDHGLVLHNRLWLYGD